MSSLPKTSHYEWETLPPPTPWGSAPTAAGVMHNVAVEQVSTAESYSTHLSCWKVKMQFLEHQLTHCPCLNDWQGYNSDIPYIQNHCSVLHSNNNCILPAPLLIHSFKWQLWAVKFKLEISYRFQWNSDLFCFITSLLSLSERSHFYSWSSFLALRCLVQVRRYAQGLLICNHKQGLTSSATSQGPCNINFW